MLNLKARYSIVCLAACMLLMSLSGCAGDPQQPAVRRLPAGAEFAGFLTDYSKLQRNPNLEGEALTYASNEATKTLRSYLAIVVDPVDAYLLSDADESQIPEESRQAATRYFEWALTRAVSDTYPLVSEPGPLVLRLRAALVGVDAGGAVAAADKPADPADAISAAVNIKNVWVEIELLDSETGEQIAAMIDRADLGSGALVASKDVSRHEKSRAARDAFDEWASRVRLFIETQHELSPSDAERAVQSYQPYGGPAPSVQ